MMKSFFAIVGLALLLPSYSKAQQAFWNYDDDDNESQIPIECDGVFDENRGGAFLPTAEEMFMQGEEFLINPDPVVRNKSGYCLIGAALQGYIPAQYRVAQLYAKGIVLPQDDLSAYRWAFLASLNGHEEASKLALLLERFLTTEEIKKATDSLQKMIPSINTRYKEELNEKERVVSEKKDELEKINTEIDRMLGIKVSTPQKNITPAQKQADKATPKGDIFSETDRKRK